MRGNVENLSRALPMLLALALPPIGLACSPRPYNYTIDRWNAEDAPRGWEIRSCSPDWQARAGDMGAVKCYRLAAGTSPVQAVKEALRMWGRIPDMQRFNSHHWRIDYGPTQTLDIHDKGARGVFVNYLQQRKLEEYVRAQVQEMLRAAEQPSAAAPLREGQRPSCSKFAPINSRFFASCTLELRGAKASEWAGRTETKAIPVASFILRPNAKLPASLLAGQPYAAYKSQTVCGETKVSGLQPKRYADIWVVR